MSSHRRAESMMQFPVTNSAPRVCVQGARRGAEGSEVVEGNTGDASTSTSAASENSTTPPISTFASATPTPREPTSRNRRQTQSLGSRTMMMKDETARDSKSSLMGCQSLIFDKIASFLDYHDQANLKEAVLGEKDVDEDVDMKDADVVNADVNEAQ